MRASAGDDRAASVRIAGSWRIQDGVPLGTELTHWLSEHSVSRVAFDAGAVKSWDSALVTFVHEVAEELATHGVAADFGGLPEGAQRLLALASASGGFNIAVGGDTRTFLAKVGDAVLGWARRVRDDLDLWGSLILSTGRFATGRARVRMVDVVAEMVEAGARALPIVTLTAALLGAIIAFVGTAALRPFGAGIYVANVVAIAMLRELGAIMTAIVMAGRTGSAYAAQLATMKLTQEIDALETMAVPSIDFLVLPRVLALSLMQPLLCVYANFVGIAGGGLVAVSMLSIPARQYLHQTRAAASLSTFAMGVGKSLVFAILVAFLGCRAGLRTGRSAAAVGNAATAAMVGAIVAIIVTDGMFAVIFQVLRI